MSENEFGAFCCGILACFVVMLVITGTIRLIYPIKTLDQKKLISRGYAEYDNENKFKIKEDYIDMYPQWGE